MSSRDPSPESVRMAAKFWGHITQDFSPDMQVRALALLLDEVRVTNKAEALLEARYRLSKQLAMLFSGLTTQAQIGMHADSVALSICDLIETYWKEQNRS